ncbi:MAG: IS3 family transposase [Bosea sp. (in: a-proteobacteria)]
MPSGTSLGFQYDRPHTEILTVPRLGGEHQTRRARGSRCRPDNRKRGVRPRPEHPNHVWSYDFVEDRTHNGRKFRMVNVIDEFTRECIAIRIDRKLKSTDVIDVLSDLFILRGVPGHVRSDNGPEFVANAVRDRITAVGAKTAFIEPGSPGENGYCESFNSKLRDELLNGELFYSLAEARIVIEGWRQHYNTRRPHSSLGYRPPAPVTVVWPAEQTQPTSPTTSIVTASPPCIRFHPSHQSGEGILPRSRRRSNVSTSASEGLAMSITIVSSRAFQQNASEAQKAARAGPVVITNRGPGAGFAQLRG